MDWDAQTPAPFVLDVSEQTHFTEKRASRQVTQDHLSAGKGLGHFDETNAYQVEGIGGVSFRTNDGAGFIADQRDLGLELF